MRLGSVSVAEELVIQDPRFVRTKAAKKIRTTFFPVGGSARQVVGEWVMELRGLGWGEEDPLFPATNVGLNGDGQFAASGSRRAAWRNADPIRKIFRRSFEAAGLPYFKPHSFRKTIVQLGERICPTPEAFKAWSQNLGHEQVSTTFTSYGPVEPYRQSEIIRSLSATAAPEEGDELAAALAKAGFRLTPLR
jgi:integrase